MNNFKKLVAIKAVRSCFSWNVKIGMHPKYIAMVDKIIRTGFEAVGFKEELIVALEELRHEQYRGLQVTWFKLCDRVVEQIENGTVSFESVFTMYVEMMQEAMKVVEDSEKSEQKLRLQAVLEDVFSKMAKEELIQFPKTRSEYLKQLGQVFARKRDMEIRAQKQDASNGEIEFVN